MANLIRLKQIESGSALQTSANVGNDFSQSVINIVVDNVNTILPDGVVSSSIQVDLLQTTNFGGFSSSISNSFSNVYNELASITGSLETGLSASVALSFSQSNATFNQFSQSVGMQFSASNANTNTIFNQLSQSVKLELSASNANSTDISSSVNTRLVNLERFSSSLDDGYATDAELTLTSSLILDQGEW